MSKISPLIRLDRRSVYDTVFRREPFGVPDWEGRRCMRVAWSKDIPRKSAYFVQRLAGNIPGQTYYFDLDFYLGFENLTGSLVEHIMASIAFRFEDYSETVFTSHDECPFDMVNIFALLSLSGMCDARLFTESGCSIEIDHDDDSRACYCFGDEWINTTFKEDVARLSEKMELNIRIEEWPQ